MLPNPASTRPGLAILFWFYDHLEVCVDRVRLLRELNPDCKIYGLFGGLHENAARFSGSLTPYLDHFYTFPLDWPPLEKWRNGDLMIAQWFRDAGTELEWDTLIVAQWDMLILEPVEKLFRELKKDELYVSSVQPIERIERRWFWTAPWNPPARRTYEEFLSHIRGLTPEPPEILACLFVVVCLPRLFLQRYTVIDRPELGFLEYRLPTYARLFGTPLANLDFAAALPELPETFRGKRRFLVPIPPAIPLLEIYLERCRPHGAAVFHPYTRPFYRDLRGILRRGLRDIGRDLPRSVVFHRMEVTSWLAARAAGREVPHEKSITR